MANRKKILLPWHGRHLLICAVLEIRQIVAYFIIVDIVTAIGNEVIAEQWTESGAQNSEFVKKRL